MRYGKINGEDIMEPSRPGKIVCCSDCGIISGGTDECLVCRFRKKCKKEDSDRRDENGNIT